MKPGILTLRLLFLASLSFLAHCAAPRSEEAPGATHYLAANTPARAHPETVVMQRVEAVSPKHAKAAASPAPARTKNTAPLSTDALDDYDTSAATQVSDPLEGMNRAMFRFNDGVYEFVLRPISKGYEIIAVRPVRQGIDNFFENVKYPVRFVNCGLQGKFKRAGLETGKFMVNTVGGVGGLFKVSDKIPALADVPAEDTGLTFAHWGIGHGAYIVLPVYGPTTMRDGVGLAGDYVLNPVNWGSLFAHGRHARNWTWIPPAANTLRQLPGQLEKYDSASANAVDPYIAVRSAYIQNRTAAAKQ